MPLTEAFDRRTKEIWILGKPPSYLPEIHLSVLICQTLVHWIEREDTINAHIVLRALVPGPCLSDRSMQQQCSPLFVGARPDRLGLGSFLWTLASVRRQV